MWIDEYKEVFAGKELRNNNIFRYIAFFPKEEHVLAIIDVFLQNTKGSVRKEFLEAERALIFSIIYHLAQEPEERDCFILTEVLKAGASEGKIFIDSFYEGLDTNQLSLKYYNEFSERAGEMADLVIKSCLKRFKEYNIPDNPLAYITRYGVDKFVMTIMSNTSTEIDCMFKAVFRDAEERLLTAIIYYLYHDDALMELKYVEHPDEYKVSSLLRMTGDAAVLRKRFDRLLSVSPEHPSVKYYKDFKLYSDLLKKSSEPLKEEFGYDKENEPSADITESLHTRLSFWKSIVE